MVKIYKNKNQINVNFYQNDVFVFKKIALSTIKPKAPNRPKTLYVLCTAPNGYFEYWEPFLALYSKRPRLMED